MGLCSQFSTIVFLCWMIVGVELFSVAKNEEEDIFKATMLDSRNSDKIEFACPHKESFCIPRTKCSIKFVVYDREALRFQQSKEFVDHFGCGAFNPTWTYVCCMSVDRLDSDWSAKPTSWFYPNVNESKIDEVELKAKFAPILLPWPGYGDVTESSHDESNHLSPISSENDRNKIAAEETEVPQQQATTEKPPSGSGTQQQPPQFPMFPQFPQFPQFANLDNMLQSYLYASTMFMMHFPWNHPMMWMPHFPALPPHLAPFSPSSASPTPSDSRVHSQPNVFHAANIYSPANQWSEMILIFPDGTTQRTLRSPAPSVSVKPPQTAAESNLKVDENEVTIKPRARRSASFQVPLSNGGLWTGPPEDLLEETIQDTEDSTSEIPTQEGRSFIEPPNRLWGSITNEKVAFRQIPASFNVNNERCGVSSRTGINARILSGRKPGFEFESETSFAEFPWHAAVLNGETGDYLCAGTIISARFVLTVAHCVQKLQKSLLMVRVGDWDLKTTREMFPSYDVEVSRVTVHEDFYAGNLQNDIAMLELKYPLDFSFMPHVGSICLPPNKKPIYSDCRVTGWGQQALTGEAKADESQFSRTLKQTPQTLMLPEFCEKSLRRFLGQFYQFPRKGMVCAYESDGKDSCFGDGGGALACLVNSPDYPKPNQYHVVGLVSWGVGCGMPKVPSAYVAIWDYLDWIWNIVSPLDSYPHPNSQEAETKEETMVNLPIQPRIKDDGDVLDPLESTRSSRAHESSAEEDFIDLAFPAAY